MIQVYRIINRAIMAISLCKKSDKIKFFNKGTIQKNAQSILHLPGLLQCSKNFNRCILMVLGERMSPLTPKQKFRIFFGLVAEQTMDIVTFSKWKNWKDIISVLHALNGLCGEDSLHHKQIMMANNGVYLFFPVEK